MEKYLKVTENTVAIMMATYNGQKYIKEQIYSLINQSYKDWILFIRDDDSSDETGKIIEQFGQEYEEQIVIVYDKVNKAGGAKNNFAYLHKWVINNYKFNYFMFCDQDDVWLPEKIENALREMKKCEQVNDEPILIHTDLIVVDEKLKIIDNSYVRYRSIQYYITSINRMLIQNNVTGCTMLWNKKLNDIVGDMTEKSVVMHDWWIALAACLFGKVIFLKKADILYRQHSSNTVGATKVNSISFILMRLRNLEHVKYTLQASIEQAALLKKRYSTKIDECNMKILTEFCDLREKNKFQKIRSILRYSFYKQGLVQVIGELIFI